MNTLLWTLQVLSAASFLWIGYGHAFRPATVMRVIPWAGWISEARREFLVFIGICEVLGAIGLILPASTGVLPWLTPLAALGLTTMMLLAAGFHVVRGEYLATIPNIIFLAALAPVACGR